MLKQEYNRMNEKIQPDPALKVAVLEKTGPRRFHRLRPVMAAALVLALVLTAVPVMAASNAEFRDWLSELVPSWAERLMPVQEGCTANGISVEVVGISVSDSEAELLLGFRQADGTPLAVHPELGNVYLDGYHSWSLSDTYTYTLTDSMEKALMLKLTCRNGTREEFFDSTVTVLIDSLALPETAVYELPLTLTENRTMTVPGDFLENEEIHEIFSAFGVGTQDDDKAFYDREAYTIIAPGEAVTDITERVGITGMGYINGELHIQICQQAPYEEGNFFAWLEDSAGNRLYEYACHSFRISENGADMVGTEYYFDVPEAELANYRLMVEVTENDRVEGPWRVSFRLSEDGTEPTE